MRLMTRQDRRRQLELSSSRPSLPKWSLLPLESREEVLQLLVQVLRQHVVPVEANEPEVDDE